MSSLRHIFRMLAELRARKSELMTSISGLQFRLFPELEQCFAYRSITKKNIVNTFSRQEILDMNFDEFIHIYKNNFGAKSIFGKIKNKVQKFFLLVHER